MSSFLCFICHSTVNADTTEEMREKYREVVGMNLCPDSHLCHICCHVMNRLWLFRSVCLKRSLEYPVLFSEKGTLNLQRNDLEIHTVCSEDCEHYKSRNINSKYYQFTYFDGTFDSNEKYNLPNEYVELEDERQEFDEIGKNNDNFQCNDGTDDKFINEFNYNHNTCVQDVQDEFVHKVDSGDVNEIQDKSANDPDEFEELNQTYGDGGQSFESLVYDEDIPEYDNPKSPIPENNDVDNIENTIDDDHENIDDPNKEDHKILQTEENLESVVEVKKKKKKKKHKGENDDKKFEKFLLSTEEQKSELEARRKDKKYIEAEFKCYNCALGFLFKDTYQAHMMRHEESNGEHLCPICGLRFATTAVLRAHTALHAERHLCLRCRTVVKRRHRADHARGCFQVASDSPACHLCGRVFKDSKALQQHLKRYHRSKSSGRTYLCNVCGERCGDQAAVRTHMLKHLQRRFPCDLCARTFSTPYTLRAHRSRHVDVSCDVTCACGSTFSSEKAMKAHVKRSKIHAEMSYPCTVCTRMFSSSSALRAHTSAVHAPRVHPCPACPAKHARKHRAGPAGPRALCHLCGGSFKGNSKLNRHLREVCEKDKLEEELASYYTQANTEG